MSSSLLGIEIRDDAAILTVVDRRGRVAGVVSEPLDVPAAEWWAVHPEERFQAVVALLERAVADRVLVGGRVAGIGLAGEPGLVLLDRELEPIPPREIPWDDMLEEDRGAGTALRVLGEVQPRWARRVGTVLSTVDFLRFRLTGAVATHADFAWSMNLVVGPGSVEAWDPGALEASGVAADAFPPIFTAEAKVGVVSPEVVERTGIPAGVWVNAGSAPRRAELLVAAEPRTDLRIATITPSETLLWASSPSPPEAWAADCLPLGAGEHWYREIGRGATNGTDGPVPAEWLDGSPLVLDFRSEAVTERWPVELPGSVQVSWDSGGPGAGPAIQAGLGLGWWRDPRSLWRKKRAPQPYEEWWVQRAERLETE